MGRKSARTGKHFYICFTLLILLSGCSLSKTLNEQRDIRESMAQGHSSFMNRAYEESLAKYRDVMALARNDAPADTASFNIGLIYAHPDNPNRNERRAIEAFRKVISDHAYSPWVEQSRIWIGVLDQAEKLRREAENSREEAERSRLALEKSRQDAEKLKEVMEKSRQEVDRTRQEMEKSRQVLEKANQIDIEIDKKRRVRGK